MSGYYELKNELLALSDTVAIAELMDSEASKVLLDNHAMVLENIAHEKLASKISIDGTQLYNQVYEIIGLCRGCKRVNHQYILIDEISEKWAACFATCQRSIDKMCGTNRQ